MVNGIVNGYPVPSATYGQEELISSELACPDVLIRKVERAAISWQNK